MDVPLKSVTYERACSSSRRSPPGPPAQFSGTLQGDTLSGTMQVPGGQAGRFTLKYLQ